MEPTWEEWFGNDPGPDEPVFCQTCGVEVDPRGWTSYIMWVDSVYYFYCRKCHPANSTPCGAAFIDWSDIPF